MLRHETLRCVQRSVPITEGIPIPYNQYAHFIYILFILVRSDKVRALERQTI